MSVEIAWKQNILVTDFHLLKSLLVVLGFGSQAFVCGFSRQNINSALQCIFQQFVYILSSAVQPTWWLVAAQQQTLEINQTSNESCHPKFLMLQ